MGKSAGVSAVIDSPRALQSGGAPHRHALNQYFGPQRSQPEEQSSMGMVAAQGYENTTGPVRPYFRIARAGLYAGADIAEYVTARVLGSEIGYDTTGRAPPSAQSSSQHFQSRIGTDLIIAFYIVKIAPKSRSSSTLS